MINRQRAKTLTPELLRNLNGKVSRFGLETLVRLMGLSAMSGSNLLVSLT